MTLLSKSTNHSTVGALQQKHLQKKQHKRIMPPLLYYILCNRVAFNSDSCIPIKNELKLQAFLFRKHTGSFDLCKRRVLF